MVYAAVDPVIATWARAHQLTMHTEFGGQERRFCYLSGGPQECFQISIAPPEEGQVQVDAWSVETIDDAELHESWRVPAEELGPVLDRAFDLIGEWKVRVKGPATWTPPAGWQPKSNI